MNDPNANASQMLLDSALADEGKFFSTDQILDWLKTQNEAAHMQIEKIAFDHLHSWQITHGSIQHDTGKFFSINGINVRTNWGKLHEWQQPIIVQPEVGYLGFITKLFDGVLHFLVQAKIEPGNVNCVQLAPTLQATCSNYTQVHRGKKPLYLEYFQNPKPHEIFLDQLQSEQGARFLKKRNRSIILNVEEDIPVHDGFVWLTLGQLKKLMQYDYVVSTATRTVVSGIPLEACDPKVVDNLSRSTREIADNTTRLAFRKSALLHTGSLHSIDNIISFITQLKSVYDLEISPVSLNELDKWLFDESEIRHEERKYFKVIAVHVVIDNREVSEWSQPMIEAVQEGLCAFVCKEINGLLHFAVQAKLECGNHDIIEFAPTVQCLTGNYRQTKEGELPFLDYVLNAKPEQIVYDTMQSEEGGRFFHEQNRHVIVLAGNDVPVELPSHYIWMTLGQLRSFLKYNNYVNIQARSLIASIPFI